MPFLTPRPGPGLIRESVALRAGEQEFTFTVGESTWVPPQLVAGLITQLKAIWGSVATPAQPTAANQGAGGATSYTYAVALVTANGDSMQSPVRVWATGNANLGGGNGIIITPSPADLAQVGITGWRVIRTAGGPSQGDVSGLLPVSQATFTDTGGAASAYSAAGSNPGLVGVSRAPEQG